MSSGSTSIFISWCNSWEAGGKGCARRYWRVHTAHKHNRLLNNVSFQVDSWREAWTHGFIFESHVHVLMYIMFCSLFDLLGMNESWILCASICCLLCFDLCDIPTYESHVYMTCDKWHAKLQLLLDSRIWPSSRVSSSELLGYMAFRLQSSYEFYNYAPNITGPGWSNLAQPMNYLLYIGHIFTIYWDS